MYTSRRKFLATLAGGSAVISLGGRVPAFLAQAAAADRTGSKDTILVVVQMTGGNDGLNTVVPYNHDEYRKARPKLAIPASDVLKINDTLGFHPSARGLSELLEGGKLAIVQGVGYPEPNRSHFESMDVWHTCQRKGSPALDRLVGTISRCVAKVRGCRCARGPCRFRKAAVGARGRPRARSFVWVARVISTPGRRQSPAWRCDSRFGQRRQGADRSAAWLPAIEHDVGPGGKRAHRGGAARLPNSGYLSRERLATRLKTIAQLIDAGLKTRVYYVELDGFDTHSQQAAAHAALLQQLGGAVRRLRRRCRASWPRRSNAGDVVQRIRSAGRGERQRRDRPWRCRSDVSRRFACARRIGGRTSEPDRTRRR